MRTGIRKVLVLSMSRHGRRKRVRVGWEDSRDRGHTYRRLQALQAIQRAGEGPVGLRSTSARLALARAQVLGALLLATGVLGRCRS